MVVTVIGSTYLYFTYKKETKKSSYKGMEEQWALFNDGREIEDIEEKPGKVDAKYTNIEIKKISDKMLYNRSILLFENY